MDPISPSEIPGKPLYLIKSQYRKSTNIELGINAHPNITV